MLFRLSSLRIAVGNCRSAIQAVRVEIHAGLTESMHVLHARWLRVSQANRQCGGIRPKTNSPSTGRLRQFPHGRPVSVFELNWEAKQLPAVLAIPGKPVDFHLRLGKLHPSESHLFREQRRQTHGKQKREYGQSRLHNCDDYMPLAKWKRAPIVRV